MDLNLSKKDHQEIEMFLNIIIDQAKNLNSGNIAHKASSIILHSNAIRSKLNKPKYKCYTCKDTGKRMQTVANGMIPEQIDCPICKK